ncbi:MAG TPA: hypothetical protein VGH49_00635 [Xanthobacteraceae bacterium]
MKSHLKKLTVATLSALVASPAFAASRHHIRHYYGPDAYGYVGHPFNAGGVASPGPIYRQGHYLGTDPDARVRAEIARDPYFARR